MAVASAVSAAPRAACVLAVLEKAGVTHVIGLPDNGTAALFDLLAGHATISLITVTREGEAFAIATGLWLGGRRPFVLIQNTGLLESGDSVRGTVTRMAVPLVMLVGYRGHARLAARGRTAADLPLTNDVLTRPDIDATALLTEPTLHAWGVPFVLYDSDDDVSALEAAFQRAEQEQRPVALLLTRNLH
jgi:sulfopyruvate decarboxylase TPP-binding subunit